MRSRSSGLPPQTRFSRRSRSSRRTSRNWSTTTQSKPERITSHYLHQYAWTKIVRHAPVPGRHSPDDPALAQYWADRRRKRKPPQLAPSWERALRTQHGRCPLCGEPLLHLDNPPDSGTQWETWYRGIRTALTHRAITENSSRRTIYRLVHTHCARRQPGAVPHQPDQPLPNV